MFFLIQYFEDDSESSTSPEELQWIRTDDNASEVPLIITERTASNDLCSDNDSGCGCVAELLGIFKY